MGRPAREVALDLQERGLGHLAESVLRVEADFDAYDMDPRQDGYQKRYNREGRLRVTFEGMVVAPNGAVAELMFDAEGEADALEFLRDYAKDDMNHEYDIEPVGGTRMIHVRPDGADDGDWTVEVVPV